MTELIFSLPPQRIFMNKDLYKSYYKKIIEDTIAACKKQALARSNNRNALASSANQPGETAYTRDSYQDSVSENLPTDPIQKNDPEQSVTAAALSAETLRGTSGSTSGGSIPSDTYNRGRLSK